MAWLAKARREGPDAPGAIIWAWGGNSHGQLGTGSRDNQLIPAMVELSNVKSIAAGTQCALALLADGSVWAWGFNDFGKLGDGTEHDRLAPVQIPNLRDVAALAAGARTSYALTEHGDVWAWGGNAWHELGVGPTGDRITRSSISDRSGWPFEVSITRPMNDAELGTRSPVRVSELTNIREIAAGGTRAYALNAAGKVWAWGDNQRGRLGDGTTVEHLAPVPIRGLPPCVAIASSETSAYALDGEGRVWAWGGNDFGQLGDGTHQDRLAPVPVRGLTGVKALAAGHSSVLALRFDGTVWGWGLNHNGQLGIGTQGEVAAATEVVGLSTVRSIASGATSAYAVTDDGSVWAWGDNVQGQLGDPTRRDSLVPFRLAGFMGITEVAARHSSVYVLATGSGGHSGYSPAVSIQPAIAPHSMEPGSVWAWGDNYHGQLGDGSRDSRLIPSPVVGLTGVAQIAFTGDWSLDSRVLALRSDGTVCAWGGRIVNGAFDGSRVPEPVPGVTDIVSIHEGFAVQSDGTLWDLRVTFMSKGTEIVPDFTDAQAVHPIQPLLYVTAIDGTTAVVELDDYSWAQKGSYFWGRKKRPLDGPREVTEMVTWTDCELARGIDGFYRYDVALTRDGAVWQWRVENPGTNERTMSRYPFRMKDDPSIIPGLAQVTSIRAGDDYCVAVKADGTVWAWGENGDGQLGNGTRVNSPMPTRVVGLADIVAVDPFGPSCFALAADGTVWAWGRNSDGQLGDGTNEQHNQPVHLSGPTGVTALHSGFAITGDGRVWSWGTNAAGRLADGTETSRNTPQLVKGITEIATMASSGSTWFAVTFRE